MRLRSLMPFFLYCGYNYNEPKSDSQVIRRKASSYKST